MSRLAAGRVVAGFAMREAVRRKVFVVVAVLTVLFLGLYGLGVNELFDEVGPGGGFSEDGFGGVDPEAVAGATLLGLGMFATLFLGTVLAVFLTLGVVRGDAERGLLQPLLVRPLDRPTLLAGRFAAAAAVCAAYVVVVFLCAMLLTGLIGGWWPDRVVGPALSLALAVSILAALSLTASVVLSSTANGILTFMVFGAGLTAGLLGQIGGALDSETLTSVAEAVSWALPFEALYQDGLAGLTTDTTGFTKLAVDLGPFGGAQDAGPLLWPFALLYAAAVLALGAWRMSRRDL